ncbi:arsenic resistance protein [Kurthia senegalensis]|uniref:arsenic resistance protein n=1 Tax=Kurthia senegalensis TaxID=1033740 RepID=UPI000287A741|nr:bile acid:sodium symporter [Kurthia senegalensis]
MNMREKLENHQVIVYGISIVLAVVYGLIFPHIAMNFDQLLSVVMGILMYGMFSQIPFTSVKKGMLNRRFLCALLIANYIAVPVVVFFLTHLFSIESHLLLGVCLVLLAPCIDYVIVFTALGKGDAKQMLLATPLLLVTQLFVLPFYLTLFLGKEAASLIDMTPFIKTFLLLIVVPLVAAIFFQLLARRQQTAQKWLDLSAWLPVPFMALTLFIIIASQIHSLQAYKMELLHVLPVYMLFMVIMPFVSKWIATLFRLPIPLGRALLFSSSTRNSLVVLPLAFALPAPFQLLVAAVIVTQTIVEMIGELLYIRLVPNVWFKNS